MWNSKLSEAGHWRIYRNVLNVLLKIIYTIFNSKGHKTDSSVFTFYFFFFNKIYNQAKNSIVYCALLTLPAVLQSALEDIRHGRGNVDFKVRTSRIYIENMPLFSMKPVAEDNLFVSQFPHLSPSLTGLL